MLDNIHPDFIFDYPEPRVREIFERVLNKVCNFEHLKPYLDADFDFDIIFCDDAKIKEINSQYREKDCPTDVITFALFFDCEQKVVCDGEIHLGEILISLDTAQRQAAEIGITLEKEVSNLIAHGILHLLGIDHLTQEDYNFVVEVQNHASRF